MRRQFDRGPERAARAIDSARSDRREDLRARVFQKPDRNRGSQVVGFTRAWESVFDVEETSVFWKGDN